MASCLGPGSIRTRRCRGVEGRIGLALAESQVAAIRLALMSKVLVMTGGPGVGKTTIVNAFCASSQRRAPTFCCAPRPAAPPNA